MRQPRNDENILSDAIAQAKTLRNIAMTNAKYSLKQFLAEEKLPLDDLANTDDIDELVDKILKRSKENSDDYDPKGDPYLNCKHKLRKKSAEDVLDERNRYSDGEEEFELDFGDGDVIKYNKDEDDNNEDEPSDFADDVIKERIRKNQSLMHRTQFRSSPALISSGVGSVKISPRERQILTKNLKLNENFRQSHSKVKERKENLFNKETQDAKDLIKQRAKITKSDKHLARRIIGDIEIKKKLK
jgi:hypothetical protein